MADETTSSTPPFDDTPFTAPQAADPQTAQEIRATNRWQARMAPLMVAAVIATAVFFASVSVWQYSKIEALFAPKEPPLLTATWDGVAKTSSGYDQLLQLANNRAAFELEQQIVSHRYEQAKSMISIRAWTRSMGFMTGMILAFLGAAFILGKISERENRIGFKASEAFTTSIQSASPGIILATLGTLLMAIAMSVKVTVETRDTPVYFAVSSAVLPALAPTEAIGPAAPALGEQLNKHVTSPLPMAFVKKPEIKRTDSLVAAAPPP